MKTQIVTGGLQIAPTTDPSDDVLEARANRVLIGASDYVRKACHYAVQVKDHAKRSALIERIKRAGGAEEFARVEKELLASFARAEKERLELEERERQRAEREKRKLQGKG